MDFGDHDLSDEQIIPNPKASIKSDMSAYPEPINVPQIIKRLCRGESYHGNLSRTRTNSLNNIEPALIEEVTTRVIEEIEHNKSLRKDNTLTKNISSSVHSSSGINHPSSIHVTPAPEDSNLRTPGFKDCEDPFFIIGKGRSPSFSTDKTACFQSSENNGRDIRYSSAKSSSNNDNQGDFNLKPPLPGAPHRDSAVSYANESFNDLPKLVDIMQNGLNKLDTKLESTIDWFKREKQEMSFCLESQLRSLRAELNDSVLGMQNRIVSCVQDVVGRRSQSATSFNLQEIDELHIKTRSNKKVNDPKSSINFKRKRPPSLNSPQGNDILNTFNNPSFGMPNSFFTKKPTNTWLKPNRHSASNSASTLKAFFKQNPAQLSTYLNNRRRSSLSYSKSSSSFCPAQQENIMKNHQSDNTNPSEANFSKGRKPIVNISDSISAKNEYFCKLLDSLQPGQDRSKFASACLSHTGLIYSGEIMTIRLERITPAHLEEFTIWDKAEPNPLASEVRLDLKLVIQHPYRLEGIYPHSLSSLCPD